MTINRDKVYMIYMIHMVLVLAKHYSSYVSVFKVKHDG